MRSRDTKTLHIMDIGWEIDDIAGSDHSSDECHPDPGLTPRIPEIAELAKTRPVDSVRSGRAAPDRRLRLVESLTKLATAAADIVLVTRGDTEYAATQRARRKYVGRSKKARAAASSAATGQWHSSHTPVAGSVMK